MKPLQTIYGEGRCGGEHKDRLIDGLGANGHLPRGLYYAERPKNDLLQLNVATPILDRGCFFFLHNLPQDLSISSVFYAKESASSQMPGFFEETGTG